VFVIENNRRIGMKDRHFNIAPQTTKMLTCVAGWDYEIGHYVPEYGRHILTAQLHGPSGDELAVEGATDRDLCRAALDAIRLVEAEAKAGGCLV
jgi:hypothetical protein